MLSLALEPYYDRAVTMIIHRFLERSNGKPYHFFGEIGFFSSTVVVLAYKYCTTINTGLRITT